MIKVDIKTQIDALERLVAFHTKNGNQEQLDATQAQLTELKAKQEPVKIVKPKSKRAK